MYKLVNPPARQCSLVGGCAHPSAVSHRRSSHVARVVAAPETNKTAQAAPAKSTHIEPPYDGPPASARRASAASTSGRVVLETEDELRSTWEHRAWVGGTTLMLAATLATGLAQVHDLGSAVVAGATLFGAYVFSDLGTGVYHWFVDNYGDASTPVFGSQIAAFQGHHVRPWTITEREFANNVHKVFKPAAPVSAVLLALAFVTPAPWAIFSSTLLFLGCMSQQFHAWSHMKGSTLPAAVVAAQEAGLLISRKAHGAHHKAPFEGNYCIVSGWWNPVLDKEGAEDGFFRSLERVVHRVWGVEPRCWYPPVDGWEEMQRPAN